MGKRRSFSAQFKAKESPWKRWSATQTMAELAAKHHLHPNVIAQWKRQARESVQVGENIAGAYEGFTAHPLARPA